MNPQQGRTQENYRDYKKQYEDEIAREAPPYLAYIEMYDKDLTDTEVGQKIDKKQCTGSLISTQHVLTYV